MGVSGGCFSRNSCPNAGYGVGNNYPRSVLGVGVGLALPNAIRCDFKTKQGDSNEKDNFRDGVGVSNMGLRSASSLLQTT